MTLCGLPAEARSNLKSLERPSPYVFTIYTERLDDWFGRSQSEGSCYLIGWRFGTSQGSSPWAPIPVHIIVKFHKYPKGRPYDDRRTGCRGTFLTQPSVPLFRSGQGALPCNGISRLNLKRMEGERVKPAALTGKARDVVMQELEAHHKAGFGKGVSYYRKFYERGKDALNVKNGVLALHRTSGDITLRGLYKYRKLLSDEAIDLALDQLAHAKCSDVEINDWRDNWLGLADKPLVEKVRRQYSREFYLLRAMQLDEEKRKEIE